MKNYNMSYFYVYLICHFWFKLIAVAIRRLEFFYCFFILFFFILTTIIRFYLIDFTHFNFHCCRTISSISSTADRRSSARGTLFQGQWVAGRRTSTFGARGWRRWRGLGGKRHIHTIFALLATVVPHGHTVVLLGLSIR